MSEMYFPQLGLFEFDSTITGTAELFPAVWRALEGIASPDVSVRIRSLDELIALDAPRLSPLVAYVLATRLIDPSVKFRMRVIEALGNIISNGNGESLPLEVRRHLKAHCAVIGRGTVLAMLEVAELEPSVESQIAAIFNLCSHSGAILTELMSDRRVAVSLRRQAIHFIGRVGFIEAIPYLERLAERLSARSNGQKKMSFAPPTEPDESTLLTSTQAALTLLQEP
ncbi:MAG: hypothetical protein FJ010_05655 [Chloroflexi bacterium]|nr:hypothetical protein [Chloroflexota bacterium]